MVSNLHEDSNAVFNIISFQDVLYGLSLWYMLEKNIFFSLKFKKLEPINNYELLND
jgi:hypothetical protein